MQSPGPAPHLRGTVFCAIMHITSIMLGLIDPIYAYAQGACMQCLPFFHDHLIFDSKCIFIFLQVPNYIGHVDKRLSEESERLLHYLDNSTRYDQYFK